MSKRKSSLVDKVTTLLSSLCGRPSQDTQTIDKGQKLKKRKLSSQIYKTRQTFALEETLIKMTRKNILEEQFMTGEILTLRVQQHLSKRINNCTIGAFKGDFLPYIYRSIISPIIFKDNEFNKEMMDPDSDIVIGKVSETLLVRKLDVLLVQLYYGQINQNELAYMQNILLNHFQKVQSIIFICGKNVSIKQYSKIFKIYSQIYMFQVQRVMLMEQLQFHIIYCSKVPEFLRIKDQCIQNFIIQYCQINLQRMELQENSRGLLASLMQNNLHVQICKNFAQTANQKKNIPKLQLFPSFVKLLYQCCEPAKKIIQNHYKQDSLFDNMTPSFGRMSTSTQF